MSVCGTFERTPISTHLPRKTSLLTQYVEMPHRITHAQHEVTYDLQPRIDSLFFSPFLCNVHVPTPRAPRSMNTERNRVFIGISQRSTPEPPKAFHRVGILAGRAHLNGLRSPAFIERALSMRKHTLDGVRKKLRKMYYRAKAARVT